MISAILLLFIYAVGIGSITMMWSLVGDRFFPYSYAWPFTALFILIMAVSTVAWVFDNRASKGRHK